MAISFRQFSHSMGLVLCLGVLAGCDSDSSPGISPPLETCNEPAGAACYNVTFTSLWNATDHPVDFPGGAHFSPMIGATHTADVTLWMAGGFASEGIERMAERGSTSVLRDEINAAIDNLAAQAVVRGSRIESDGKITFSFTVTADFPLFTLTSMIAPSPDWFVGVDGVSLRENRDWVDGLERDLLPYDAGTDDGATFTSGNANSDPQDAIERLVVNPFSADSPPLARLTIERVR